MKIVNEITIDELKEMSNRMYGGLVKAVVDIDEEILVVDAEMHVDQEKLLLEKGSKQQNLWGINLYPEKYDNSDFIEFDSMINLRPSQNNFSRRIEDTSIQDRIKQIVLNKIKQ